MIEIIDGSTAELQRRVLSKEDRRALFDYFTFRPSGGETATAAAAAAATAPATTAAKKDAPSPETSAIAHDLEVGRGEATAEGSTATAARKPHGAPVVGVVAPASTTPPSLSRSSGGALEGVGRGTAANASATGSAAVGAAVGTGAAVAAADLGRPALNVSGVPQLERAMVAPSSGTAAALWSSPLTSLVRGERLLVRQAGRQVDR